MPSKTKTSKTEVKTTVAPVQETEPVHTAPIVDEKPQRQKKAKKTATTESAVAETQPVEQPVAPTETVKETSEETKNVESGEAEDLIRQSTEFFIKLNQLGPLLGNLKAEFKTLEKKWSKEIKSANKGKMKKRKSGNSKPSGFTKPSQITPELASFLGVDKNALVARTEVVKFIGEYVRKHKLSHPDTGRIICPDETMAKVFNVERDEKGKPVNITYFDLQKYISPHFPKSQKTA